MHVLICDDDASTRFVMRRLLTQHLGCTTIECADGVEALRKLDEEEVDLIVLDVEMPAIDGVEVLEAIRSSPSLRTLPVLMLSKERREDIVVRVVRLGIEGYILKPPRTEKVLGALERLRGVLATRGRTGRSGSEQSIVLGPDTPALLIDGNLDYRHFFVTEGCKQGPIMDVASGAAALAQFRQLPTRLIFVGSELGVLGPELLVPKLRALAGGQPVRIVGIVDPEAAAQDRGTLFDDVLARSFVPDKLKSELRRFASEPGPMTAVTRVTGDLAEGMTSAARQVFGMMLDADVEAIADASESEPMVAAISDMTIQNRYVVELAIRTSVPSISAIAARMLGMLPSDVTPDDYLATVAELANLVSGRMHAHLDEGGVVSDCSLPRVEREPAIWDAHAFANSGVAVKLRVGAMSADLIIAASVRDLQADAAGEAAASIAASPAL